VWLEELGKLKKFIQGDHQEGDTHEILEVTVQRPEESWPTPYIHIYMTSMVKNSTIYF
jgi:hypothetical protein